MLTRATVLKRLHYCQTTGLFTHIAPIGKSQWMPVGSLAGTKTKSGYLRISLHGKQYLAHRLAWLCVYGKWPKGFLDHINGDRLDNRIENLRIVSKSVNSQNVVRCRSNNRSGFLGVSFRPRQGWVSQINVAGKVVVLGFFSSPEEAHILYLMAKLYFHDTSALHAQSRL